MKSEAQELKFCPPNTEEDTRIILELGSADDIDLSDLLNHLDSIDIKYEEAKADNLIHKCDNVKPIPHAQSYKAYAGVDASKKFSRNYLIVADESGTVRYIEARHSYREPGLSN